MSPERLDPLIWTLIYGGLLTLCLSLFVGGAGGGATMLATGIGTAGALAAVAGVVLWLVRARLTPPVDRPPNGRGERR